MVTMSLNNTSNNEITGPKAMEMVRLEVIHGVGEMRKDKSHIGNGFTGGY